LLGITNGFGVVFHKCSESVKTTDKSIGADEEAQEAMYLIACLLVIKCEKSRWFGKDTMPQFRQIRKLKGAELAHKHGIMKPGEEEKVSCSLEAVRTPRLAKMSADR